MARDSLQRTSVHKRQATHTCEICLTAFPVFIFFFQTAEPSPLNTSVLFRWQNIKLPKVKLRTSEPEYFKKSYKIRTVFPPIHISRYMKRVLPKQNNCSLSFKTTVSCDATPCRLLEIGPIALMVEAVSTSETSANFYQGARRNIPEDSQLHTRHRENMKSHVFIFLLVIWWKWNRIMLMTNMYDTV
jgi:hypothetical protein